VSSDAGRQVWEEPDEDPRTVGSSVYDRIHPSSDQRSGRELLRLVREAVGLVWGVGRRTFLVATAVQLVASIGLAAQLLIARTVLQEVLQVERGELDVRAVALALGALALIIAAVAFAETVSSELTLLLGELTGRRAAEQVIEVSAAVPLEAFERPDFYDRLERARFNAGARNMAAARSIVGLIGTSLAVLGIGAALVVIEPLLVPLMLVAPLPMWLATSRNSREFHRFQHEMTTLDRERTYLMNVLSRREEAPEIRSFSVAEVLRGRHDRLYATRIAVLRRMVARRLRRALGADLARAIAMGGTLLLLLWLLDAGRLSVAAAGTAILGLLFLTQRLRAAMTSVGTLYESALFLEDVRDFAALKPALADAPPGSRAPRTFERIVVDDATFTYPGSRRPALRGAALELRAGEVVALVGENGSGKTTLAKLLCGLHAPAAGRITWDDTDISDCDPEELRASIAVLFQDFVHWHLPADDNIGLGRSDRMDDQARIRDAARRAGADGFLSQLPRGYDTILSRLFPGGRDLSAGQWQRVAFARALFRDAPLLILDEPTAALDPLAEARLFDSLRSMIAGRTALFISHRFSSVRLADRIYVLEEGRMVEHGTHDELMARGERYAHMFTLQAHAYLREPVRT
jgi:ATP-binding cassette subfamily B protein